MFGSLLSILSGALKFANKLLGMKERKESRDAGARDQRLRSIEGDIEDVERMRKIERDTGRLTDVARRDALSRFVRHRDDDGSGDG